MRDLLAYMNDITVCSYMINIHVEDKNEIYMNNNKVNSQIQNIKIKEDAQNKII